MNIVNQKQIIRLCAKSLRLYDERLVDHGERVAYIAQAVSKQLPNNLYDNKILLILSVFHDAGAYKTEEIDRMVEFETKNVEAHSVYGYLFLKYFTPIGKNSKAILYHHKATKELEGVDEEIRRYAEIIHLADRLDIAIAHDFSIEEIENVMKNPIFNKELVVALCKALKNSSLYENIRSGKAQKDIIETMSDIPISIKEATQYLKMLVYSSDFKSEFTVVHSINTTVISLFIAWRWGLEKENMEKIYYAALIHDVGKMAIPANILEHPGRLDEEQMKIMRKHVVYTREIIEGILPKEIVEIAVRHHELLDGSGYPLGLDKKDLTICDRIVAVADVLSALGSKRSYKDQYSKEKIFEILHSSCEAGKIDKEIVALVEEHYDDLQKTIQTNTAPIYNIYDNIQKEYMQLVKGKS